GWSHEKIETAISAREEARRVKNFAEADRIRDELESNGVVLEDSTTGTEWKRIQ
ncbi:MAG: cysteine--tRNA ligase, partial [Alphaproteobacteria bacterium]|nr:cysteine--tRNA ligase [Alphaproteobacteria bacterium]